MSSCKVNKLCSKMSHFRVAFQYVIAAFWIIRIDHLQKKVMLKAHSDDLRLTQAAVAGSWGVEK